MLCGKEKAKERWRSSGKEGGGGEIDSVCFVLAYLKNTVGAKANKHGDKRK